MFFYGICCTVLTIDQLFELLYRCRVPEDNQRIARLDFGVGIRIKDHLSVPFFNADNYGSGLFAETRTDKIFANESRAYRDLELLHLQLKMLSPRSNLDEIDDVRAEDRLSHSAPSDYVWRDDLVRTCPPQLYLRPLLSGTGKNVKIGVETSGCQGDVDIFRIGCDDGNQPFGSLYSGTK